MMYKVFNSALFKIILGLIVCIVFVIGVQLILEKIFEIISFPKGVEKLTIAIITSCTVLSSYIILYKAFEKRKITELSFKKFFYSALLGISLGFILQAAVIFVIYLNNGYEIVKINSVLFLIPSLAMAIASAVFEEVLFRGIIFRLTEEKLGTTIALIISAALFGGVHLLNDNSTLFSALSIALQAGVLLGAAYVYTRNLWLPICIHFAWNFSEAGIFGAAVSGNDIGNSLITSKISGSQWLTGGSFGPENSIQATVFCSIAAIIFLLLSIKQNKIIKPFWKTVNLKKIE